MESTEENQELIDIGAWVGRQQAFAVIANQCSSAQALSLKQVRESRSYEKLGLTFACKPWSRTSDASSALPCQISTAISSS